jgi:hypothetical protein
MGSINKKALNVSKLCQNHDPIKIKDECNISSDL